MLTSTHIAHVQGQIRFLIKRIELHDVKTVDSWREGAVIATGHHETMQKQGGGW